MARKRAVRSSEKVALVAQALKERNGWVDNAAMIGDRHFDIEGARANAIRGIGVLCGFGSAEERREAGADRIVATPSELSETLAACLV